MGKEGKGTRTVGIYGSRLGISAVGASLGNYPDFLVQKIEDCSLHTVGGTDAAPPDVILFDLAAAQPHFAISLIHARPNTMVIGIDLAGHKMLVLTGRQFRLLTEDDLVQVIVNQVP